MQEGNISIANALEKLQSCTKPPVLHVRVAWFAYMDSISSDTPLHCCIKNPDSKVHGANLGPTWVLSAPDGPHDGPMNLAIWVVSHDDMSF